MPSFVEISHLPPQAWNKLRSESCGLRVLIMCKKFFLFLFGRRAQRRPFRTYCQYSYVLHLFVLFSFYFCVFLIFFFSFSSFFLLWFAHIMNTHIQWYSFIPLDIPIFLNLESPFPKYERRSSVSKQCPRYHSSFILTSSQYNRFSSVVWSDMGLVPIGQGNHNHNQKI